ncbi:E3 ubiquitin-protein ligase RNF8-like isoform X2 [Penaeus japonicus]|uniref:E3 ubiquitin-protein ligase RNF8-like isoform X2 n=1 Tax=Penaeus japonicus TaxID=27405 RepID=UPI001C7138A5|nr:E3 ubiquitin-protein ligase RNF8-like isoform X2 [Penaeus japonicus]
MEKRKCFYLKRQAPHDGQSVIIPFKKDEVLIGRSIEATHVIPHQLISRKHAVFKRENDQWTVSNLSLNGVFVNGNSIPKSEQHAIKVGDTVQFGQPATFLYRFGLKEIPNRAASSSSQQSDVRRVKSEGDRKSALANNLNQEREALEEQLKQSDAVQQRLQGERDELLFSLQNQKENLQQKYQQEKEALEQQFLAGSVKQQEMLQEKEALAQRLKDQVSELQNRLEEERKSLEENVRKEEEQRVRILQEKEAVLRRLEEENANLERQMQEERRKLEERLQVTEEHKEELQQQVEAKENEIRAKEEQQRRAEWERQKVQEELTLEQLRLLKELERVKDALTEKEKNNSALSSELKRKEEELNERLAQVAAEVEKNSSASRQEVLNQLEQVQEEKKNLEEQLMLAQAQDQAQMNDLQESLQTLEAQKMSLEQELKSTEVASACARKEVVESVSDVLENEFQCPICNELFMTAVMLNCSHTFCRYCIDQWKKNKKECPNCRQSITSETRSLVVDNFIEKIVPTLSEELKQRRAELVQERNAEMAQAAAAAAAAAEAAATRGRRAGRGRVARSGRGRQRTTQRQSPQRNRNQGLGQRGANQSHASTVEPPIMVRQPARSAASNNEDPITLSSGSDSDTTDTSMNSESSSVSGDENVYFGGYGRCYNCGRRGHWANGCPDGPWF